MSWVGCTQGCEAVDYEEVFCLVLTLGSIQKEEQTDVKGELTGTV